MRSKETRVSRRVKPPGKHQPRPDTTREKQGRPSGGAKVLTAFCLVATLFAVIVIARYWPHIIALGDTIALGFGLLLTMTGGMFVRVLSSNYRTGRELLDVTASQLLFPLLFALVVFYPIWSLAETTATNLFTFYAAFLNGYFWESVVTASSPVPSTRSGSQ